jgi:hypothetical protein
MKSVANAKGKNGEDQGIEEFVIDGIQVHIAEGVQSLYAGQKQKRVDVELFGFVCNGLIK